MSFPLSPQVTSHVRAGTWLPTTLHERLSLSPAALIPRLHSAGAGTSSSEIFTARLVEDCAVYAPSGGNKGTKKGRGKGAFSSISMGTQGGRYANGVSGLGNEVGTNASLSGAKIGLNAFVLSAIEEAVQYCGK